MASHSVEICFCCEECQATYCAEINARTYVIFRPRTVICHFSSIVFNVGLHFSSILVCKHCIDPQLHLQSVDNWSFQG